LEEEVEFLAEGGCLEPECLEERGGTLEGTLEGTFREEVEAWTTGAEEVWREGEGEGGKRESSDSLSESLVLRERKRKKGCVNVVKNERREERTNANPSNQTCKHPTLSPPLSHLTELTATLIGLALVVTPPNPPPVLLLLAFAASPPLLSLLPPSLVTSTRPPPVVIRRFLPAGGGRWKWEGWTERNQGSTGEAGEGRLEMVEREAFRSITWEVGRRGG